MRTGCGLLPMLAVAVIPVIGRAAPLSPGTYHLNNHPDGGVALPGYGLRLDEAFGVVDGHRHWTFDFEHDQSAMFLDYSVGEDSGILHIYGISYGGLDSDNNMSPGYFDGREGLFDIDFTFDIGVETVPGDDDLHVVGTEESINYNNFGYIRPHVEVAQEGNDTVYLFDYAGNHGYTFRLGDENHDDGHRGFDGISGWGWLNYQAGEPHVYAADWLFTVGDPVPAPGAALLGGLGLFLVNRYRARNAQPA